MKVVIVVHVVVILNNMDNIETLKFRIRIIFPFDMA